MNKQERSFALKISLIMATRMLGLFMIFPVFSVYAKDYISATPFLIGLAIGIYGLTQALFQIPFGYLSDKFGRKPLIILGLIIFFIGSVVAANASDIIGVIVGRALQGGGAISAVLMAFLADFVEPDNRSKANAFIGMQIGLAFMLSLLIGPTIAAWLGMSNLFWVIAILAVVGLLVVLSLPHVKPQKQYSLSIVNFKKILTANLLKLDFSMFFLHLILTATFVVVPLFLVENNIVAIKDSWQIYLPVIVISFIIMLPMIIFAEKYKKTKIMLLLAVFILTISQILFYQADLSYVTFFILLTIFFTGFNALEAILPSLVAKIANTDKRGLAMGLFSTSQFLGAFTGGLIGGWIYHIFDLNSVFLFTTFIGIIWWIIILTLKLEN